MSATKAYLTTERAGYWVAGRKIPAVPGQDGKPRPKIGHVIDLTDEEAKYELLSGVIAPEASVGEPAADVQAAAPRKAKA